MNGFAGSVEMNDVPRQSSALVILVLFHPDPEHCNAMPGPLLSFARSVCPLVSLPEATNSIVNNYTTYQFHSSWKYVHAYSLICF